MSLRKYKKIKYLGKGSYGAAILVSLRGNEKKKFVIKEIVVGHMKEREQLSAKKEAEVLSQMQHSNITMYIESFVEGSKLYIVMEFADGGDLSNTIANRKKTDRYWQENELMRILVHTSCRMGDVAQMDGVSAQSRGLSVSHPGDECDVPLGHVRGSSAPVICTS